MNVPDEDGVTGGGSQEEPKPAETHSEETKEPKEPRKYAGKFDSVEDMEKGYAEAQGKMTQASQEAAEAKRFNEQWQQYYAQHGDSRGDVVQTTEKTAGGDENWYADKAAVQRVAEVIADQKMAIDRGANANIRAELGKRRKDRLFSDVADDFEAALIRVDPKVMANPQQAIEVAEHLFNAQIGQMARKLASEDKTDPARRKAQLEKLGFEPPAREESPQRTETVQSDGMDMLTQMGVSKEGQKRAAARLEKLQEGGA